MAAPRWNPRVVLDVDTLDDQFTCTGITKKNQRCRNRVNIGDRMEAASLLNEIAMLRPNSSRATRKLEELAQLTLCKRWHRGAQADEICSRWDGLIDEYVSTLATVPQRAAAPITQPHVRASQTAVADRSTIRVRTELAHQYTPAPRVHHTRSLETLPSAGSGQRSRNSSARRAHEPQNRSPELPLPALRTGSGTFRAHAQLLQPASPILAPDSPLHASTSTSTSTHVRLAESVPNPVQETPTLRPAEDGPNRRRRASPAHSHRQEHNTHARHVTRQPITEDCAICYEKICCEHSAVWCRAQCGQNVHEDCFAQWRLTTTREAEAARMDETDDPPRVTVTCVYCRAPWLDG